MFQLEIQFWFQLDIEFAEASKEKFGANVVGRGLAHAILE
jgi:hypothetical protein